MLIFYNFPIVFKKIFFQKTLGQNLHLVPWYLFNVKCVGVFYNIVSPTRDYLRKRVRLDLHTARSDTIFLKIMMTV